MRSRITHEVAGLVRHDFGLVNSIIANERYSEMIRIEGARYQVRTSYLRIRVRNLLDQKDGQVCAVIFFTSQQALKPLYIHYGR